MGTLKPPTRTPAGRPVRFRPLALIGLAMAVVAVALLPRIFSEEEHAAPKLHPKEEEKLKGD